MSTEMSIAYSVRGSMRVRSVFPAFKMPESMGIPGVAEVLAEIGSMEFWDRDLVVKSMDRRRFGVGADGIMRFMGRK